MRTITIKLSVDELLRHQGDVIIHLNANGACNGMIENEVGGAEPTSVSFFKFMEEVIDELRLAGKVRSVETYRVALNSLKRFCEGKDFAVTAMDGILASRYEQWLLKMGIMRNTSSFYMRVLRAVYNRAVRKKLTTDQRPFDKVYTGIAKTKKRAVDIDVIRQLATMAITDEQERFARDMFMFSFFTQGMSFVDMAYLKKTDIVDNMLTYYRRKTGQQIQVTWTERMQQLVDANPLPNDLYLLPIIRNSGQKERSQLRHRQYQINEKLQELAKRLGLQQSLTMYVARHSWASIARSLGIPLEVISHGMGHNSESTTRIYLKEIDNSQLANANRRIMDFI